MVGSSFTDGMSVDLEEIDATVAIGNDERRMHVRAYNYWSSLLAGREFPSIEDLDSRDVSDFADLVHTWTRSTRR